MATMLRAAARRARLRAQVFRAFISTYREGLIDLQRHVTLGGIEDEINHARNAESCIEAQLIKDAHRVEKGLALAEPRSGFGVEVERRLVRDVARYRMSHSGHSFAEDYARDSLASLSAWRGGQPREATSAVKPRDDRPPIDPDTMHRFFASRSSVRDFSSDRVDRATIEAVVANSLYTPSVCNRQAWRVLAIDDPAVILSTLALQNGNRGFGESVPLLLIVGVDARLFTGTGERNQRWIDGGLFAMTMAWALHGASVDTCLLNWSVTSDRTSALRNLLGLPLWMDVITMIAVGHAAPGCRVARSPRRSLDSVLQWHGTPRPMADRHQDHTEANS